MPTDIKLDQNGGNWLLIEGNFLKTTTHDVIIDAPSRRRPGPSSPMRRALVHDFNDGLTINWGGDYPGGVTVTGNLGVTGALTVTGDIKSAGVALNATIAALQSAVASLQMSTGSDSSRLAELERTVESLVRHIGAVVIPFWSTKEEVEEGGMVASSAESLGLIVEYEIDQRNPNFTHEQVIGSTPPPGTVVLRGSTVKVEINLEG